MHDHHHDHHHTVTNVNRAFIIGIILNSVFVAVEAVAGFWTQSLALLTDAGHNLSDVAALALSLLAFKLAKQKATERYTYGYRKTTVLVTLLNAVILLVAVGGIGYEAIHRFFNPQPLQGNVIAWVAGVGILINSLSAYLFLKDKEKDLNIQGAYLHMAADALVSAGVVVAGILISYTQWYWLDSVISFVIMAVILASTWKLLMDSLRLSLDGVPDGVDILEIRTKLLKIKDLIDVHHLHVWAISTTQNALTAHLVVANTASLAEAEVVKQKAKHALEHLNIHHATVEIETEDSPCDSPDCIEEQSFA
ncbi:MAG: cation diffusion facilitator family transporter [Bacteroidota bacterium]